MSLKEGNELAPNQPIAMFCVLEDFSKNQKGMIVIYKTVPHVELIEVLSLMESKNLMKYDHYKYNGIPVIAMRISQVEYDHYKLLGRKNGV